MGDPSQDLESLEGMLRLALSELRALAPTPRNREYRARAESYRLTLSRWHTVPPSGDQREAMRELIRELEVEIQASSRRGSLPPRISGDGAKEPREPRATATTARAPRR